MEFRRRRPMECVDLRPQDVCPRMGWPNLLIAGEKHVRSKHMHKQVPVKPPARLMKRRQRPARYLSWCSSDDHVDALGEWTVHPRQLEIRKQEGCRHRQ